MCAATRLFQTKTGYKAILFASDAFSTLYWGVKLSIFIHIGKP